MKRIATPAEDGTCDVYRCATLTKSFKRSEEASETMQVAPKPFQSILTGSGKLASAGLRRGICMAINTVGQGTAGT